MNITLRRIQITSKITHIISLPIEWIRRNNLKEKDVLEIADLGNYLVIKPYNKEQKIEKDIKEFSSIEMLKQFLVGAYIKHFDSIIIRNTDEKTYIEIKNFGMQYLEGFISYYDHHKNTTHIMFSISPELFSRETFLNNVFSLAGWFIKEAYESIPKKRKHLKHMYDMDADMDKYYYLSERIYAYSDIASYTRILENLCDSLINIAELRILSHKEIRNIQHILKEIDDLYTTIVEYYSFKDAEMLSRISLNIRNKIQTTKKRRLTFINEPLRLLKDLSEKMIDEIISS